MSLTDEEMMLLAKLKEKKRQGLQDEEKKKTEDKKKKASEVSKALAKLKFANDGTFSDVEDREIRGGIRHVYKDYGTTENILDERLTEITPTMFKSHKKEIDFIKKLADHNIQASINTHNLLLMLRLRSKYEEDFKEHDLTYTQNSETSNKRRRVMSDTMDKVSCGCRKSPACNSRCPCRKANLPCNSSCRCLVGACENPCGHEIKKFQFPSDGRVVYDQMERNTSYDNE